VIGHTNRHPSEWVTGMGHRDRHPDPPLNTKIGESIIEPVLFFRSPTTYRLATRRPVVLFSCLPANYYSMFGGLIHQNTLH